MRTAERDLNLNPKRDSTPVDLPDCYIKIAEIAFYKAEKRGFSPGHEFDDWIEAELEFRENTIKNDD
jgi:hypothetical protein